MGQKQWSLDFKYSGLVVKIECINMRHLHEIIYDFMFTKICQVFSMF
jgi:hypothetical protein